MGAKKSSRSVRNLYMVADFSPEEKQRVLEYCLKNKISASHFLADIALEEVRNAARERAEEEITITLKVPREQSAKAQMFARRQNKTMAQFFADLLRPVLEKGKTSFTAETQTLRYYVSAEEHRLIKKYLKSRKLSARTYISFLAIEALQRKPRK